MGSFNMLPVAGAWEVKLGLGGVLSKQVVGIPFAQQLSPVGGTPPYTVTKLGGPAFLSVNNSGVVFGTPALGWRFQPHRQGHRQHGKTADQTVPLTVQDGCDSRGATPHAECLALVDIYRKTGGNGWATKTNWFATSPCSWYGITCHASGSIAHIVLENEATVTGGNNLVGSISTVPWQNLPNLQIVNLQHNTMTGALPASLVGLPGLQVLDVSGNNFGPTIPTFPAPANLRELDLAENLFTGSIAGIANETALTLLDLANNGTSRGALSPLVSRR